MPHSHHTYTYLVRRRKLISRHTRASVVVAVWQYEATHVTYVHVHVYVCMYVHMYVCMCVYLAVMSAQKRIIIRIAYICTHMKYKYAHDSILASIVPCEHVHAIMKMPYVSM